MPAHLPDAARARLPELLSREEALFAERTARSRELFGRAREALLAGVPMSWMALICPATTAEQVDRHTVAFDEALTQLL